MTAQKIKQIARTPVPGWVMLAGALVPLAAAGAATARTIRQAADARYVLSDSMRVIQAGYALDRRTDSLNKISETKDMRHYLDSTAKDLKVCIRHPEDCR
jgi:hypothetical protein